MQKTHSSPDRTVSTLTRDVMSKEGRPSIDDDRYPQVDSFDDESRLRSPEEFYADLTSRPEVRDFLKKLANS